jgi:hypothetical protein
LVFEKKMGIMTILYDDNIKKVISGILNPYYVVDGKRPILDNGIYELDYIEETIPEYDFKLQSLEQYFEVDLLQNLYIKRCRINQKSNYEIDIDDWIHTSYSKRVVVPYNFIYLSDKNPIINLWIIKNLPIKYEVDFIYLYDNSFDSETDKFILLNELEVQLIPIP